MLDFLLDSLAAPRHWVLAKDANHEPPSHGRVLAPEQAIDQHGSVHGRSCTEAQVPVPRQGPLRTSRACDLRLQRANVTPAMLRATIQTRLTVVHGRAISDAIAATLAGLDRSLRPAVWLPVGGRTGALSRKPRTDAECAHPGIARACGAGAVFVWAGTRKLRQGPIGMATVASANVERRGARTSPVARSDSGTGHGRTGTTAIGYHQTTALDRSGGAPSAWRRVCSGWDDH